MLLLPPLTLDERPNALGGLAWEQTALELAWGLLCKDAQALSPYGIRQPGLGQAGWALRGLRPIIHRIEAWREVDVDGFSDGWHLFLHAQTLHAFLATASLESNSVLGHLHNPKHTFAAWMAHLARAVVHQACGRALTSQGHPPTAVASGLALTTDQWELVASAAPEEWLLEASDWPRHPNLQRQAAQARLNDWRVLLGEPISDQALALGQWWQWNHTRRKGPAPSAPAWMSPWATVMRTQAEPAEVEVWSWAVRRRLAWMHQQALGWPDTSRRDALLTLALVEHDEEMTTCLLEAGAHAQPDALFNLKQPHLIAPMLDAGAQLDATNQDGTVVQWAARTAPQTVPCLLDLGAPLGTDGMMGLAHRLCVRPEAGFDEWQHAMAAVGSRRHLFETESWWKESKPLTWLLDNATSDKDIVAKVLWLQSLGLSWPDDTDACQAMKAWIEYINVSSDTAQQAGMAAALGERLMALAQYTRFNLTGINVYGQNVLHILFAFCTKPAVIEQLARRLVTAGVDMLQEDQAGHTPHAQPLVTRNLIQTLNAPLTMWLSQSRARRLEQQFSVIEEEEPPKRKRF